MLNKLFAFGLVGALSLAASTALAEGAVKVECWGACNLVSLGQICDSYAVNAVPIAVACDDTGVGVGRDVTCGSATCRPYGGLSRNDLLSAYCDDGGGYDAIVSCRAPNGLVQLESPKLDDRETE